MPDNLALLKRALQDPILPEIECILTSDSRLAKVFCKLSPYDFVSEWKYGLGIIYYECHRHSAELGMRLKMAYEGGTVGGHPSLTGVYSYTELAKLIHQAEVASGR